MKSVIDSSDGVVTGGDDVDGVGDGALSNFNGGGPGRRASPLLVPVLLGKQQDVKTKGHERRFLSHCSDRIGRQLFRAVQHTLINRELNSLRRWPRAEIIHSRLQSLLPPIEMHTRQLTESWALQMNIQALALADEGTSIRSEIQHRLL